MCKQDADFSFFSDMALEGQESHFSCLSTLLLHPNLKLARADARPEVGFLARMESFLMSFSIEASVEQEAQEPAECPEE